jgi:glutaredoxin-related protein
MKTEFFEFFSINFEIMNILISYENLKFFEIL